MADCKKIITIRGGYEKNICYKTNNSIIYSLCFSYLGFFQNELLVKIIISPFLICSFAVLMENIFLILNKIKLSNFFKYMFRISFFIYVGVFLMYSIYYSIINKYYPILIIVVVFLVFAIYFFKKAFFDKK